ncbi:MAG: hypothetical protein ACR2OE_14910 [Thermomicrobiales bacterium]
MTGLIPLDSSQTLEPWSRETCVAFIQSQTAIPRRWHAAKLFPQEVDEIRELLDMGDLTHRSIAARYDVTRATITSIATGNSWKRAA